MLKDSLLQAPVLGNPGPSLNYIFDTNASLDGVGAVLLQIQDGRERALSYFSHICQEI